MGKLTLDTKNPGDVVGYGSEDFSFQIWEAVVCLAGNHDFGTMEKMQSNADGMESVFIQRCLLTLPKPC
jgi:hypothetical protein